MFEKKNTRKAFAGFLQNDERAELGAHNTSSRETQL